MLPVLCRLQGAQHLQETLEKTLGIHIGETTKVWAGMLIVVAHMQLASIDIKWHAASIKWHQAASIAAPCFVAALETC
eukprot:1154047-Pelagomonas_calceolata.AAC.2